MLSLASPACPIRCSRHHVVPSHPSASPFCQHLRYPASGLQRVYFILSSHRLELRARMRITSILLRDVYKQIESYSKFNPSPLSIKKFIDFGESSA